MTKRVKISEARAKLFDLVDFVIDAEDDVVLIEHRDRTERAALLSERYLRYLTGSLEQLKGHGRQEFRLAGSIRLLVSEEALERSIAASRAREDRKAEQRFQDL
jgi:PHD/YefM family antitoxin component YafN of YafNO toxin-antitoxin module